MKEKKGVITLLISHPPAIQSNRAEVGFVPDFTVVTIYKLCNQSWLDYLQIVIRYWLNPLLTNYMTKIVVSNVTYVTHFE